MGPTGEDSRTALRFLKDLRDHGLHDVALDYIKILRDDAQLPAEVKDVLDYEEGRTLIDEAARSSDLVLREELLRDARTSSKDSSKRTRRSCRRATPWCNRQAAARARPHGHAPERRHQDTAKKDAKVAEARAAFNQAHDAYGKAIEPLKAAYKKFAGFIEKDDPRQAERDAIYTSLLDAMLQQGVADYELAETYPAGSPERAKSLKDALAQFESLYKNSPRAVGRAGRPDVAGQVLRGARRDRRGHRDLQGAHGAHRPSAARPSAQRGLFLHRRPRQAEAIRPGGRRGSRWLATYNRRDEPRPPEGLGVLIEHAKNLDAQMTEIAENERPRAIKQIVDSASQVVRYASPYKKEALDLLKKYKPSAALKAEDILRLTYEDAINRPTKRSARRTGTRRSPCSRRPSARPTRPATSTRPTSPATTSRSAITRTTSSTRPTCSPSTRPALPPGRALAKATEIAMQSLADAYNTYTEIDRMSDSIARSTWRDTRPRPGPTRSRPTRPG